MAMSNVDITITSGDNYIMFEGKKIPLTDEQVRMLKSEEKPKKSPFEKLKCIERYYFINAQGDVGSTDDFYADADNDMYSVANYCTDKTLMEQRALHETLNRLLWRFSMENGEGEKPWDGVTDHWYIYWEASEQRFDTGWTRFYKHCGSIYFPSHELARRALDEIVEPFMKEHPEFVW